VQNTTFALFNLYTMRQVTIKAVTAKRDFDQTDRATFARLIEVLKAHNLSVIISYQNDRHKHKTITLKKAV